MYTQPARYAAPTLGPRVCKRWASRTRSTPRQGRKGHLYGTTPKNPPPSPEEEVRITKRRIAKAERDERIDISMSLTPVKTYMGGFTRPRDLRSSNWFPGGRYTTIGKVYESPPESAYEPHTVYLLESRYPVKHGLGRVDCYDHVVGICREGDFEAVLRRYNSARAPRIERESMDNARWPWMPQFQPNRTKWWAPGENPRDIIKEIFGEEGSTDLTYLDDTGRFKESEEEVEMDTDDPRQLRANVEEEKSDNHVQGAVVRQKRRTTAIDLSEEEMSERQRKSDAIFGIDEGDAELIAELKSGLEKAVGKLTDNQKRGIHTSAIIGASEVPHQPFPFEEELEDIEEDFDDVRGRSIPPHIGGSLKANKFPKHGKAPKARQASLVSNPPTPIPSETKAIRDKYLPTLAETPFWRPLLSITLSTRPLAVTLARLSRARSRGLAFFATICNDDRKTRASYSARIQCMRIDRMENLTVQIAQLLAGARGGFIGIRFGTQEKGRGIGGEGLEAPLSKDKRTIKVGVGNWYRRAEDVKEAFREDAVTQVGEVGVGLEDIGETFEISGLDDYGRRIDDKTGEVIPWPISKSLETAEFTKQYQLHNKQLASGTDGSVDDGSDVDIVQVWRNENEMRRVRKLKRQELARSYTYEIALQLAQKHRAVTSPY